MTAVLNDELRRLASGPNFAILATVNPDGSPQTSVVWVGLDGDDLVFSIVDGRRKVRNMRREPRVSVTIIDHEDPYNYGEIRGLATIEPEGGPELDQQLSWKYDNQPAGHDAPGTVRIVARIQPTKTTGYAAQAD
ncbi:MAG: PPOX class F420-dependent oxidoreductase [Propionibacteriaceae bacterium]